MIISEPERNRRVASAVCKSCAFLLGLVTITVGWARPGPADMLVRTDSQELLVGRVVQQESARLLFDRYLPDGTRQRIDIPQAEILLVQITIESRALAALDPAQPAAYLELADELAGFEQDFLAVDTARRLYLVASSLARQTGDERLLLASLWGLWQLADSAGERRRIAVLAMRELPRRECLLWERRIAQQFKQGAERRGQLLSLLQAIRESSRDQFKASLLGDRGLKMAWDQIGVDLAWERLLQLAQGQRIALREQRQLWLAELKLLELQSLNGRPGSGAAEPDAGADWLEWAGNAAKETSWPAFETITEFDPLEVLFRDGRWVREK